MKKGSFCNYKSLVLTGCHFVILFYHKVGSLVSIPVFLFYLFFISRFASMTLRISILLNFYISIFQYYELRATEVIYFETITCRSFASSQEGLSNKFC